ncbi:hypothetical protein ES707_05451 [subsurface metagenome]
MKRKIFSILLVLVLVLSFSLVTSVPVAAADLSVPDPYGKIQDAIDAAIAGDTIIVSDGIYEESLVVNTANLTLESVNGRGSTTIRNVGNAGGEQTGFLLMAGATNFTLGGSDGHGFTIEGGTGTAPRLIQLNNGPSGVELSYNTFDSSDTNGTISTGINIGAGGATGLIVDNNIFITDEDASYQDWPLTSGGPLTNLTVTDNEFTGSGIHEKYGAAIDLNQSNEATATLSGGTITNNTISGFDRGILTGSGGALVENLDISQNDISGCGKGIMLRGTDVDMATVTVTENNIHDNTLYGIENTTSTVVTAKNNWWGDASGPTHISNPSGIGDEVSDNVTFTPWLNAAFPGGSAVYLVHINGVGYDTIQAAIDAAIAGNTIVCKAGIFTEDLTVSTANLTLKSESGMSATTITTTTKPGIEIQGTATNFVLGGASGESFTIDGTAAHLIVLANNPSGVVIAYNTIDTTDAAVTRGISVGVAGATYLAVSNNTFTGNTGDGSLSAWDGPTSDVNVFSNTFENGAYAIQFSGVTGTSIIGGNFITGYDGAGAIVITNGTGTSGLTISENEVTDCSYGVRFEEECIYGAADNMTTVTVTQNTITDSTNDAIKVGNGVHLLASNFVIENNNISGSTNYGLQNAHSSESVTAENNWWGDISGPSEEGTGTGDAVSTDVDYIPWLDAEGGEATYPATINGVGYDTIQEAVTAALPDDVITVTPGTYVGDITVSEDLTLVAPDGAKLTGTGPDPVVTIGDYTVILDGFEIDPGTDGVYIPTITTDNVVTIENAVIHDNTRYGIEVDSVYGTLNVIDCIIADNIMDGIYIALVDDGGSVNIKGNVIGAWTDADYDFDGNDGEGIYFNQVLNGSTVTIGGATEAEANLIAENGYAGIYVNELYYGSTLTIEGNCIGAFAYDSYTFNGNDDYGVYVYYVDYGSTVTIRHNAISENDYEGIYINYVGYYELEPEAEYYALFQDYDANTVTIEENWIGAWEYDGYSFIGNDDDGIYIYDANFASNITIQNNTISENYGEGIELEYLGDYGDGFYLDPYSSDLYVNPDYPGYFGPVVLIKGNRITDNYYDGIYQYGDWEYGTIVTIENNLISGNLYAGIYHDYTVEYDAHVIVRGNTITNNGVSGWCGGIYYADLDYASSYTIEGNLIAGNLGDGIYIDDVYNESSVTIEGNTIGAGTDAEGNRHTGNDGDGIYISYVEFGSSAEVHWNNIVGNYNYGVYCSSGDVVDATNNWWGDVSGPGGYGPGSGDGVSDYVYFSPWLTFRKPEPPRAQLVPGWNTLSTPIALATASDELAELLQEKGLADIEGTADDGTETTLVDDALAKEPYYGRALHMESGDNANEWRPIVDFVVATDTLTVHPAFDNPIAEGDMYRIVVMEIAYGFYDGGWVQIIDANDELVPCDAFYVKMNIPATIDLVPSEERSDPTTKALSQYWNLVSLANLSDMAAEDALASAYLVSGDLSGYAQVVSPSVNGMTWSAVRGPAINTALGYDMWPGEGYWVFMTNAGTLAGFSFTPVELH